MRINKHRLNSQKFQVNGLWKKQFENGAGRIKKRERQEEENKTKIYQ